jgi:predicted dehydrogenase
LIKTVLVGCGSWGQKLAAVLPRSGFSLDGVVDTSRDLAEIAAKTFEASKVSLESALANPTIRMVVVATPPVTHADIVNRALDAGKHVYCAKPLALDPGVARSLATKARNRNLVLWVDQVATFVPGITDLLTAVATGTIGVPSAVFASRLNFGAFRRDVDVIWDLAPHDLGILDLLCGGQKPEILGGIPICQPGSNQAASAFLSLNYPGHVQASLWLSWMAPTMFREFLVIGSAGMLSYRETKKSKSLTHHKKAVLPPQFTSLPGLFASINDGDQIKPIGQGEALHLEFLEIAKLVQTENTLGPRTEAPVRIVETLTRITESCASGQSVT